VDVMEIVIQVGDWAQPRHKHHYAVKLRADARLAIGYVFIPSRLVSVR